jgi:SAM-dependent methyltransferase
VDLGCGSLPHARAAVGVDAFRAPVQRELGAGAPLTATAFRQRHVQFVQANLEALPFRNQEFDFAYSHHVFEHLVDPKQACAEMMRVAGAGVIITPSVFAEVAFGRPYHRWFVLARGRTLLFVRKRADEDRPFGLHPERTSDGGYRATAETNPFELLLNDGGWYHGSEALPRLSRLLRGFWYSHSPVTEVVFLWRTSFECIVVEEDGRVR